MAEQQNVPVNVVLRGIQDILNNATLNLRTLELATAQQLITLLEKFVEQLEAGSIQVVETPSEPPAAPPADTVSGGNPEPS